MSTTEAENKELVREYLNEVSVGGNLERMAEFVSDDWVAHSGGMPDTQGPEEGREYYANRNAALPDLGITIEDILADEDTVVVRARYSGTHEGELMGIEPTGATAEMSAISIYHLDGGQITEEWHQADLLGLLQELGAIEPPGADGGVNTMSTTAAENKELVQRFVRELVNGKNYELAEELFTAEYTRRDPDSPGDQEGVESFVEGLKQLHEAFPDSEVHVGEIIAEDDLVAFEGTLTGTHEGTFRGIEPTNTEIEIPGNAMHRIRDGRIAETWATWNFLGALEQLGVVDPPGD